MVNNDNAITFNNVVAITITLHIYLFNNAFRIVWYLDYGNESNYTSGRLDDQLGK